MDFTSHIHGNRGHDLMHWILDRAFLGGHGKQNHICFVRGEDECYREWRYIISRYMALCFPTCKYDELGSHQLRIILCTPSTVFFMNFYFCREWAGRLKLFNKFSHNLQKIYPLKMSVQLISLSEL